MHYIVAQTIAHGCEECCHHSGYCKEQAIGLISVLVNASMLLSTTAVAGSIMFSDCPSVYPSVPLYFFTTHFDEKKSTKPLKLKAIWSRKQSIETCHWKDWDNETGALNRMLSLTLWLWISLSLYRSPNRCSLTYKAIFVSLCWWQQPPETLYVWVVRPPVPFLWPRYLTNAVRGFLLFGGQRLLWPQ